MRKVLLLGVVPVIGFLFATQACVGDSGVSNSPNPGADGGNGSDTSNAADTTPQAPFHLTATPDPVTVKQGNTASLTVTLVRDAGFTGAVDVVLSNLPAGVTATPVTLKAMDTMVVVTLTGAANAMAGSSTATVTGTSGSLVSTTTVGVQVPGAPGTPDPGFGTGGTFTTSDGDGVYGDPGTYGELVSMAVQPDGKIVLGLTIVTGANRSMEVVRLTPDGALDPSFGTAGKTDPTAIPGTAFSVALQKDGAILVGGFSLSVGVEVLTMARFTSAGVLDSSFGTSGIAKVIDSNYNLRGHHILVRSDGKSYLTGTKSPVTDGANEIVTALFDTNGAWNKTYAPSSFNLASWAAAGSMGDSTAGYASALQSTGNLLVGGFNGYTNVDVIASFGSTGAPSIFNNNNTFILPNKTSSGIYGLVVDSSDTFWSAGTGTTPTDGGRVCHFKLDGSLDTFFGPANNGCMNVTPAPGFSGESMALTLQADGKPLTVGSFYKNGSAETAFVARMFPNAKGLDTAFGTAGVANPFTNQPTPADAYAVAVDKGGRILVAGLTGISKGLGKLTVSRLWP